jgi:peroxiredoxin
MYRRILVTGIVLALAILPLVAAKVPREAPEFSFQVPGGGDINLDRYQGKVIALEFLLTTCPHCKRTSGVMQEMYSEFGSKGFQALGVAINEGAEQDLARYLQGMSVAFPVGFVHRDRAVDFLQHPVVMTLWVPQLIFIDKTGTIRAQYAGTDDFFRNEEENMREMIEKLLAE